MILQPNGWWSLGPPCIGEQRGISPLGGKGWLESPKCRSAFNHDSHLQILPTTFSTQFKFLLFSGWRRAWCQKPYKEYTRTPVVIRNLCCLRQLHAIRRRSPETLHLPSLNMSRIHSHPSLAFSAIDICVALSPKQSVPSRFLLRCLLSAYYYRGLL